MTIRIAVVRQAIRLAVAYVICLLVAAPAHAQIIQTMVPKPEPTPTGEFVFPAGLHVFGGFSIWEFGYTRAESEDKDRPGFLVAADFAKRVSESVTIGGGGWYNGTNEYAVEGFATPDIEHRFKRRMYSVYGSAFWKAIGVQASVVPVNVTQTTITKATGA